MISRKIYTILLILLGLVSIATPLSREVFRISPNNEVLIVLDRVNCIVDKIPQDVQELGFTPPVDLIIRSSDDILETSDHLRRLLLARYALTPKLIHQIPDTRWVIGYYKNYEIGLQKVSEEGWNVDWDCKNGVFLLTR